MQYQTSGHHVIDAPPLQRLAAAVIQQAIRDGKRAWLQSPEASLWFAVITPLEADIADVQGYAVNLLDKRTRARRRVHWHDDD